MRKACILFLIASLLPVYSYAAPCYGTRMPRKRSFSTGVQTHTIFKRYLQGENGTLRSMQNFMLLSYGAFDWLAIDLKAGAGNLKRHPEAGNEIDYSTGFSGGYGFRVKLYGQEKTRVVFGFQHISVHPKSVHTDGVKDKAVLDDWQFSLLASYPVWKMTPYIGTRWSRMDDINWVDDNRKRLKSDLSKSVGLILGLDVPLAKQCWINIEGSVFDSQAYSFSLNFDF